MFLIKVKGLFTFEDKHDKELKSLKNTLRSICDLYVFAFKISPNFLSPLVTSG